MIRITYQTYSKILDKTFVNTKEVKTEADFNLFNMALHHGQAQIIKREVI